MSLRLAGAGRQVGLSEAQILGFAAALSSVGIESQMGGSAFSKALIKMEVAAATGGDALEDFARVSGMSASQFKDLWERDAASAFQAFIVGLSKMDEEGVSAIKTLTISASLRSGFVTPCSVRQTHRSFLIRRRPLPTRHGAKMPP